MAAGGVLIIGGWVDARKAVGYVDWGLLLLVGSALGLSKAISNSGLADYAGEAIRDSGMSASASIFVLYGFTMVSRISEGAYLRKKEPLSLDCENGHVPAVVKSAKYLCYGTSSGLSVAARFRALLLLY